MPASTPGYGESTAWKPATPRFSVVRLIVSWLVAAASVYLASRIAPGVELEEAGSAFVVAAVIGIANAVLPPIIAALRLPFTIALGFVLVLLIDAAALMLADEVFPELVRVDSFGDALLAALVMAAAMIVLTVIAGTNDDDEYTLRVTRRVARRQGKQIETSDPGLIMLEIDGLALPVLQHAMRSGSAPNMARWLSRGGLRPDRVGDGPLVPDRGEPGRHPARLQRGHPGVPLGREGDGQDDRLLGARRLRRDRAAALIRPRDPARGRREPRQPALRRGRGGDPHGQPDRRREAREPRLPRLLRQRLQRNPLARPVHLGGDPRVDRGGARDPPRRAAARSPRRRATRSCAACSA